MMHAYTNSPLSLLLFSSFFFSVLFTFEAARDHDPCTKDHRCGHHSPPVRFPFRLEGQHPPGSCAYLPQFNLSCSGSDLMISLPNASNRLVVKKIDYRLQTISVSDPEKCLPFKLRSVLNGSDSHVFTVVRTPTYPQYSSYSYSDGPFDYPLFSCPPPTRQSMLEVPCKSDPGGSYNVYAVLASCDRVCWQFASDVVPEERERPIVANFDGFHDGRGAIELDSTGLWKMREDGAEVSAVEEWDYPDRL